SEIEEYQRITIEAVPDAAVRGVAVNDLVHLTAELLDNATNFSPKQAQVVLASSFQADGGLLIEIRDSGVGMSATQRNALNARLAVPPMVDVSVSRHMGLFVVGRLAARHGITVRMQATGPNGGLTAAVSVPSALITTEAQRLAASAPASAVSSNGSVPTSPVAGDSLWEAARSSASVSTGTGSMFDDAHNGMIVPAAIDSSLAASEPESLFAAAAASTLDLGTIGTGGGDPGHGLFAPSVPAPRDQTDFFAGLSAQAPPPPTLETTPIFQEMRSAWFRQRPGLSAASTVGNGVVAVGDAAAAEPEPARPEDFGSAADEGWQAAEQLLTPVDAGTTSAGLPRRRPRAHLVPGATSRPSVEAGTFPSRPNNVTPLRDAERVRGNLSSYQRGTRRGRHSTPMEDSERSIGDPTRNGVGRHGELPTSQERQ
ncbi:MAG: sensor histidine kinase, partial [Geodermatophilaceae bacterium]|nr:sensor histidine kinase [Geodermatophilaceae bacterium]